MYFPAFGSMMIDSTDATNDFYDNEKIVDLPLKQIMVGGEIANPGLVDITVLPVRSVIVKEAILKNGKDSFVGAYRYDGYSLYDILNERQLRKKNEKEFPRCIDMYVVVENSTGKKTVVTWGELYYPNNRHQIIIANRVLRIVPSLTKELWPLPGKAKLVVGHDLLSERNIDDPVKITVYSANKVFPINKEMKPLYADAIAVYKGDAAALVIDKPHYELNAQTYSTVFYGRGKGIHGISTFNGVPLKSVFSTVFGINAKNIQQGFFVISSADGYRVTYSFSEIFNRNDQAETLLIYRGKDDDGGKFSLFPAADFFSDRAIKAVSGIYYMTIK